MLQYNLQFFAKDGPGGEKTENATPKRLQDARHKGQVAKSREVNLAASLLCLFVVLKVTIGWVGTTLLELFHAYYGRIVEATTMQDGTVPRALFLTFFRNGLLRTLLVLAPFLGVGFLVAFIADFVQVKWHITFEPMKPKFNKMNPISGLKRIISPRSLVELFKAFLKISLIVYVVYQTIKEDIGAIYLLYDMSLMRAMAFIGETVINMGIKISAIYIVIAALDRLYTKYKFNEDMKMTKQEVKDEMKNTEGDPQIKGKIRQKMREASRRRMMQDIPKADVVITNPTHYAVALRYNADENPAPVVVAKGADILAQRIKEVARENGVEIVENKPLARMLYANVEIGEMVPPELYQAVAEVLAMVYQMQGKI